MSAGSVEAGRSGAPRTTEVASCPACGSDASESLFSGADRLLGVPGTYAYRRCEGCGTVFQSPRVVEEDLGLLYPGGYYTKSAPPGPAFTPSSARAAGGIRDLLREAVRNAVAPAPGRRPGLLGRLLAASRRVRERAFFDLVDDEMLPWRTPPGRALDVGCGSGRVLARLAALGWEAEGLEWDGESAEVARESTGLPVHVGSVLDADAALGPYDLIVLAHVFEHLSRPVEALRKLSSLLAEGGRIVLVYPNPRSLGARRFGVDWYHWDPPRHLVLVPGRALGAPAGRAGLRARVRTSARLGAQAAHDSGARREGRRPDGRPSPGDRVFGLLERVLVAVGMDVGEEIVASLVPVGSHVQGGAHAPSGADRGERRP